MSIQCKSRKNVNEVYIWHGSAKKNYSAIMKDGLKVGGVDYGIPIANAAAFGLGIYSATTPNTPIKYADDSRKFICCLALKGTNSIYEIDDPDELNNGRTHSHACNGDWVIFFTKEQILPRFLIEYKYIEKNKNIEQV